MSKRKRWAPTTANGLMFCGVIGVVLGLIVSLGLIRLTSGPIPPWFLWFVFLVCVPLTLYYLWTHRSPDNTRFNVE